MLRGILKMRRKRNTSVSKATSRGLKLILLSSFLYTEKEINLIKISQQKVLG